MNGGKAGKWVLGEKAERYGRRQGDVRRSRAHKKLGLKKKKNEGLGEKPECK